MAKLYQQYLIPLKVVLTFAIFVLFRTLIVNLSSMQLAPISCNKKYLSRKSAHVHVPAKQY